MPLLGSFLDAAGFANHPNGSENAERERGGKADNCEDDECSGLCVLFFKFVHDFLPFCIVRG